MKIDLPAPVFDGVRPIQVPIPMFFVEQDKLRVCLPPNNLASR